MKTIIRYSYAYLAIISLVGYLIAPFAQAETPAEQSPHAQAINLVMQTQSDAIRKADPENWWHDTKQREWMAKRTISPGIIDSTHLFEVTYSIDGSIAASWLVDIGAKSIQAKTGK